MVGNTHTLQNPCIFCIEEIICIQLKRWASKSCDLPANGSWHLGHFCQIKYSILPKWHLYLYSLAAPAGSCNFHRWSDHWHNWRFSFQVDTDPCRSRNITKQVSKIKWFWKNIFYISLDTPPLFCQPQSVSAWTLSFLLSAPIFQTAHFSWEITNYIRK